ncbi:hypothetical protein B296_00057256 [Ensete ventricosum]|uniref:Uncharacterized protein n=1 Tax=Ensete ventricosum TaxID=4639 RepID=A0A426XAJ4_ENSVE|nr:hypothetical protein B296_00057256 [Ensete ventricosum]
MPHPHACSFQGIGIAWSTHRAYLDRRPRDVCLIAVHRPDSSVVNSWPSGEACEQPFRPLFMGKEEAPRTTVDSQVLEMRNEFPRRTSEALAHRGLHPSVSIDSWHMKKKKKKKGDAQREAVPALQKTSMPKDTQGIPSAARIERLSQQPPQRGRWRRHGCRNQRNGFERHSELVGRWWSRTALLRSPSSQCNLPSPREQLVPVIQHRTVSSFQDQSTSCSLPSRLENHVVKKKKKKKKSRSK